MKTPILSALLTLVALMQLPAAESILGKKTETYTTWKTLEVLIIPEVSFSDTPLIEVCDYLQKQSQKLDPNGKVIHFVIDPELSKEIKGGADYRTTFKLGQAEMLFTLETLVNLHHLKYSVADNTVTLHRN